MLFRWASNLTIRYINWFQLQDMRNTSKTIETHPQGKKDASNDPKRPGVFWTGGSGKHLDVNYSLWPYNCISRQTETERETEEGVVGDQWTSQKLGSSTFM